MKSAKKLSLLTNKAPSLIKVNQKGFTVVEIIVAMAIFLLVVPGLLVVLWNNDVASLNNSQRKQALEIASITLNALKRQNFHAIKNFTSNDNPYQTTVTVVQLNLYSKRLTAKVSWQTLPLPQQEVSLTTEITDPAAVQVGSTCLIDVSTLNNMAVLSSLDFGPDNEATGVVARNHLVYVSTNSTTTSASDFFVVDVVDPANPHIIAQLNTGPGLAGLTVAGNFAFTGNTSINGQLQIIDISSPAAPILSKTFKLPGSYTDNTTIANALAYDRSKIYLGTQKSQIAELHVIDVTDTTAPKELGAYEINAGVNSLLPFNDLVYVASPAAEEIKIIDTSETQNFHQTGKFDAPGGSGNGKSLALDDTILTLGRTLGGQELYWLDITNPSEPNQLSNRDLNTSINAIAATPAAIFLATTDSAKTIQAWDSSKPDNPVLIQSLSLPNKATSLACGVDQLYATSSSNLFVIAP